MKLLLFLLPIVFASPDKRVFMDQLHTLDIFQMDALKCDIEIMLDALGSDPTEQACEAECTKIVSAGHILSFGCPLVCHGFSALVHRLHVTPGHTACAATAAPAVGKRVFMDQLHLLDIFQMDALKCDIEIMLDALGSDPTEQACEAECTKIVAAGHILSFGCPLVCHGFSALVHRLHVTPGHTACAATAAPATSVGKRVFMDQLHTLDIFQMDALKCDIEIMLDALGSDPTEQACEAECTKIVSAGHILSFGCPLVCHGFSALVHRLHVTPGHTACAATTAPAVGKRMLLDSLHLDNIFQLDALKCDLQLMLDQLGTAPTEAACEAECHVLLQEGHYFNYGCPLVCNGFQSLVHLWHIVPDDADPAHSKCHFHEATTTAAPTSA